MEKVSAFLVEVLTYLAALPFIVFILVWVFYYGWQKDKKLAMMRSMDITTFFLIAVVAGLLDQLMKLDFSIWLIILVFLLAFGLLGNAQQRTKGKIDARKLLRVVWRIGFILLSLMYMILLFIGILIYAMA